MTTKTPTPAQTSHKTVASTIAGLIVGGLAAVLSRWGLDLGPDETAALTVLVGSAASGVATYVTRNYLA